MIVEPNWGVFRAKFNGREEKTFEWLCSLLFSKEHNQSIGPLRYFNQAGIEEDPIPVGGEVIGWQAKFVGRLSEQTQTLKKAIDDAKLQNPSLTRIYFYVSADFTQSKKPGVKDPRYKTDIEEHAKSKGVAITWRTKSFFEKPFVCERNANIARHFFANEKSVIDFIQELSRHSEAILDVIHSEIASNGAVIKIDRRPLAKRLRDTLAKSSLVIISGVAGVGKTAVVKDFYGEVRGSAPLFVFKATEFNLLTNANQLFRDYGDFTLSDLVQAFAETEEKYVVIDSAEELSSIERPEVFQEVLATLRREGWKVIFTTRLSYLEDLERMLIQAYGVGFEPLNIENLTGDELVHFSETYGFALPENNRLRELLQNPFYLNEYLRDNPKGEAAIGYSEFRDAMWNTRIAKTSVTRNNTHRRREQCFLDIAKKRADTGRFFVSVQGSDDILPQLVADEIIKFDTNAGGYFIAHDIYAEWALDKIIERAFRSSQTHEEFYQQIGNSLPVRRTFRSWLSEKLLSNDAEAKKLIEATVDADNVQRHWKDEVIVSALLSPYADVFIGYVSAKLLAPPDKVIEEGVSTPAIRSLAVHIKYEDRLLTKILFLLRIACKDVDQELLRTYGAQSNLLSQLFAKPRGSGWSSVIGFISKHKEELGLMYMHLILPVLDEWNSYNKQGVTTKQAAQIALYYYRELTKDDGHFPYGRNDDTKERLIRTIFNGSAEIRDELKVIFDQVVADGDCSRDGPFHELVKSALSNAGETAVIAQHLPLELLALAELLWFYIPPEEEGLYSYRRSDLEIEQYFELASNHTEYYPASAFQTPILGLLRAAPRETIDFILAFTNRSIEYFAKTELAEHEVEEIEILVDLDEPPIKQYICHRIWNIYRGTQVAPALLESVHMAFEGWMLAFAKTAEPELLESWCLYLIKNSRSASITAIVASLVLAEPSKLHNVAKVLFRSRKLFFFDTARLQLDATAKSHYAMSHDPMGVFTNERIRTCDDKHRQMSLEHLALRYQLFRVGDEDEELVKQRQEAIWIILDEHYARLPDRDSETDADKTWRLYLARMDRRRMNVTAEQADDKVLISFNPEIDPELRKYSEDALAKTNEELKYTPFQVWARYRLEHNESEYKKYPQYEDDYKRVIVDAKVIREGLKKNDREDRPFDLFYRAVPSYACAVLIRDYFERLDADEKEFCKNVILDYAAEPLHDGYRYQVGDGVDVAIKMLPLLINSSPEDAKKIKETLLFTLFNEQSAGMSRSFSGYAVSAIFEHMWKDYPVDANSLFLGYVLLKPKLDAIRHSMWLENRRKNVFQAPESAVRAQFIRSHKSDIEDVVTNKITYGQLPDVATLSERVLVTGFLLLPLRTPDESHKSFVKGITKVLSKKLLDRDRGERVDYVTRHQFFEKFAYFVLTSERSELKPYLQPFLELFSSAREIADVLAEFVTAEDKLHQYNQFWAAWELFYPEIKGLCEREYARSYSSSVVHNYLLAWPHWRKDAKEWRSLKVREKAFFKRVAEEIGSHPAVFYSLAKLLNEIGSSFVEDGMAWISSIIERHPDLASAELEVNTVYYLENLVRGYLLQNRHKVRTIPQIQHQVLTILNFLLEKGSATAYLLREDVLC